MVQLTVGESTSKDFVKKLMDEFDASPKDGFWEGDHPILQMANHIDELTKKVKMLEALLESEDIVYL